MQAVLDQSLKVADADVRIRFGLLLQSGVHDTCDIATGGTGRVAGGSFITPLQRPAWARTAS